MPHTRFGLRLLVVSVAATSMVVSRGPIALAAMVQEPVPLPMPKDASPETPEARADRDLQRQGVEKTREQATKGLDDALKNLDEARKVFAESPDGIAREESTRGTFRADLSIYVDETVWQDLSDAFRYYARVYGLPRGDPDTVLGLLDAFPELVRLDVGRGLGPNATKEAIDAERATRFGPGADKLKDAALRLRSYQDFGIRYGWGTYGQAERWERQKAEEARRAAEAEKAHEEWKKKNLPPAPQPTPSSTAATVGTTISAGRKGSWSFDLFGAGGKSTWLGAADRIERSFRDELSEFGMVTTDISDRGFGWIGGAAVRYHVSDVVDVGLRTMYRDTSSIDVDVRLQAPRFMFSAVGENSGYLLSAGLELGANWGRVRPFLGGAAAYFDIDGTSTFTASNGVREVETLTHEFSGIGPSVYGGVQWAVLNRVSLFAYGSRTWTNDDSVGEDESPWDERSSMIKLGVLLTLPGRH